jgi:hypothetical protein
MNSLLNSPMNSSLNSYGGGERIGCRVAAVIPSGGDLYGGSGCGDPCQVAPVALDDLKKDSSLNDLYIDIWVVARDPGGLFNHISYMSQKGKHKKQALFFAFYR